MTSDNEEILAQRVEYLEKLIKSTKPICPICLHELRPVNYVGYYDEFGCDQCDCAFFENVQKEYGQYA